MNVALDESVVILGRNISLKHARPQKETDLEPFIVCDCVMLNESEASAFCGKKK
jgi:hypothetical protein